jgi:hypothetical protein
MLNGLSAGNRFQTDLSASQYAIQSPPNSNLCVSGDSFTDASNNPTCFFREVPNGTCPPSVYSTPGACRKQWTITVKPSALGTVISDFSTPSTPPIKCGASCTQTDYQGTSLTLTASPASSHTFVSWSSNGPCNGSTSPKCIFTVAANVTLTANFQ